MVFEAYSGGEIPYYEEDGMVFAWKSPYSDWVVVFLPWYIHERYTMEFDSPERRKKFEEKIKDKVLNKDSMKWGESEEQKLQKKYNLTLEQLNWREWAIANKCRGNIDTFRQEYPATIEEAFLSKGRGLYSKSLCDNLEKLCSKPIIVGELVERNGVIKVRPEKHGRFKIWENPDPDETYFMTCDAGGGKKDSQEKEKRDPDPTCIDVWCSRTGEQVAQWHGDIDYGMIDEVIQMVGDYYSTRIRRTGK
jgi:hypothetical protein